MDGSVGPHSFVNHYANVNDTLKQSWQKQRPVRNTNAGAAGTSSNMNTLVAHPPTTPGPPPHPSSSSAAAALLMHQHQQYAGPSGSSGNIIGLGAVGHHHSSGAVSQLPMPNYSSYEESEPEATASLSGGQGRIVLNNMARSRAPLPGFSSFI